MIDIDEACSGIRSLQAMVMVSLFLGELFRLRPGRRVLLMALGVAVTLIANVIRTVALSSIGFSRGMEAVDHYHDMAGFAVLSLSLAGALLMAFLLRPAKEPAAVAETPGAGSRHPLAPPAEAQLRAAGMVCRGGNFRGGLVPAARTEMGGMELVGAMAGEERRFPLRGDSG